MTPEQVSAWREALGGRRFLLTVGAGAIDTLLLVGHYLTQDVYANITLWTVGVFIGGNAVVDIAHKIKGTTDDTTRPS